MASTFTFVLSLIFMSQAVDVAMALHIPLKPVSLDSEAPRAIVLEMGFHSIFTTALLFSVLGVYMMTVMRGTRTLAFMARLPRGGATLRQVIGCLPPIRLPSILLALDSRGTQRRIPVRRARLSAPMATVPRRWAPCPTRHAHPDLQLVVHDA